MAADAGDVTAMSTTSRWAGVLNGAGYRVDSVGFGRSVGKGNFGHTGWGGSVGFADPSRRLGFAFVTNRLLAFEDGVDPRRQRLLDAVDAAL